MSQCSQPAFFDPTRCQIPCQCIFSAPLPCTTLVTPFAKHTSKHRKGPRCFLPKESVYDDRSRTFRLMAVVHQSIPSARPAETVSSHMTGLQTRNSEKKGGHKRRRALSRDCVPPYSELFLQTMRNSLAAEITRGGDKGSASSTD
uniref:C2H2-type domain-containing protein n=1 Tax=Steinernema glaseri TaxID=37863 RepID=A0A1I8AM76_9BILA